MTLSTLLKSSHIQALLMLALCIAPIEAQCDSQTPHKARHRSYLLCSSKDVDLLLVSLEGAICFDRGRNPYAYVALGSGFSKGASLSLFMVTHVSEQDEPVSGAYWGSHVALTLPKGRLPLAQIKQLRSLSQTLNNFKTFVGNLSVSSLWKMLFWWGGVVGHYRKLDDTNQSLWVTGLRVGPVVEWTGNVVLIRPLKCLKPHCFAEVVREARQLTKSQPHLSHFW